MPSNDVVYLLSIVLVLFMDQPGLSAQKLVVNRKLTFDSRLGFKLLNSRPLMIGDGNHI